MCRTVFFCLLLCLSQIAFRLFHCINFKNLCATNSNPIILRLLFHSNTTPWHKDKGWLLCKPVTGDAVYLSESLELTGVIYHGCFCKAKQADRFKIWQGNSSLHIGSHRFIFSNDNHRLIIFLAFSYAYLHVFWVHLHPARQQS